MEVVYLFNVDVLLFVFAFKEIFIITKIGYRTHGRAQNINNKKLEIQQQFEAFFWETKVLLAERD